jgi:alpha-galactosidase
MLAAPLIAGNDLRKMNSDTRMILTNKDVIAIDQDALGIEAFKYSDKDSLQTWIRPLKNNDWAVCFINRGSKPKQIQFNWQDEMVNDTLSKKELSAKTISYTIRDLWLKKNMGDTKKPLNASIASHDVLMLKLSK